jgi:hypothetical protein
MADEENAEPRDDEPEASGPCVEFSMEIRDSLPGDRAVVGVEQKGHFVWLFSEKYVHPKAVEELTGVIDRLLREGSWAQGWPGR